MIDPVSKVVGLRILSAGLGFLNAAVMVVAMRSITARWVIPAQRAAAVDALPFAPRPIVAVGLNGQRGACWHRCGGLRHVHASSVRLMAE